jgi:hypothetical protein
VEISPEELWALVHAVEQAAWSRKWSALKTARKALEPHLGPRPHFTSFETPGDNSDAPTQKLLDTQAGRL